MIIFSLLNNALHHLSVFISEDTMVLNPSGVEIAGTWSIVSTIGTAVIAVFEL